MKKLLILFIVYFVLTSLTVLEVYSQRRVQPQDLAVMATAHLQSNPPGIVLRWNKRDNALQYQISRKMKNESSWSAPLATLESDATTYIDLNVEEGKAYEYEIAALSTGQIAAKTSDNRDTIVQINFIGYGYVYAGFNKEVEGNIGSVILLIDSLTAEALAGEIAILENDLISEGWGVIRKYTPRAEQFKGDAVKTTKSLVLEEYNKDPENIKAVFIIGRVPVPYSGLLNPDAHPDHKGAWPADVYYGVTNDASWTDLYVNDTTSATRKENKNARNDGKFDVTTLTTPAKLQVGRVDFYNMPAFSSSEIQLLKQYLDRNHKYRNGEIPYEYKGLIDDNFGMYTLEVFGNNGWRNFSPLIGDSNVKGGIDWFGTLKNESYLWAYGCGGGSYTSCGGIGYTKDPDTSKKNDFVNNQVKALFTMLFGSYFGDWDSQNNFMRAALAAKGNVLTCAWAGRPSWYFHHMALGENIGFSTILSQNNYTTYKPNAWYLSANATIYQVGMQQIHIALLGDPTLRMYMATIPQPKNLTVIQNFKKINLSWEKPSEDVAGYNIYRGVSRTGPFIKVNDKMIKETNFEDDFNHEGMVYYIVKAVKLQTTFSGTFYNESKGLVQNVLATDVPELVDNFEIEIYPNPAITNVNITLPVNYQKSVIIDVLDIQGKIVKTIYNAQLSIGTHQLVWNLEDNQGQRVSPGVYFLRILSNGKTKTEKVIVF
ncbi:MAG: T9SS type A sorting domain-containing protein [Candidatus Kapabacteria bacterium]|nr:T9SS type A sorting domain-containing protein [Candidatus Kapabacteria bacterium]